MLNRATGEHEQHVWLTKPRSMHAHPKHDPVDLHEQGPAPEPAAPQQARENLMGLVEPSSARPT